MNLVYGSSSSSCVDCLVFSVMGDGYFDGLGFVYPPCSSISASVIGLLIFGRSFCCSHTFRMSTRRLPVILFVSRLESPFVAWSVCVAGGGSYYVRVLLHVSHLRLIHSLLIIILLLPPPCALRTFCSRLHVACYCNYLRYFHSMTVSCPSGLSPFRWLPVRLG